MVNFDIINDFSETPFCGKIWEFGKL